MSIGVPPIPEELKHIWTKNRKGIPIFDEACGPYHLYTTNRTLRKKQVRYQEAILSGIPKRNENFNSDLSEYGYEMDSKSETDRSTSSDEDLSNNSLKIESENAQENKPTLDEDGRRYKQESPAVRNLDLLYVPCQPSPFHVTTEHTDDDQSNDDQNQEEEDSPCRYHLRARKYIDYVMAVLLEDITTVDAPSINIAL